MKPTPALSQTPLSIRRAAAGLWTRWDPLSVGVVAMLAFCVPSLLTIWGMHLRADDSMQKSLRYELLAAARAVAQVVNPDVHATFVEPSQEQSKEYVEQIRRMETIKTALDVKGMIKFVYTCLEQEGGIYIVLDTTNPGDSDGDGQDDKAHIMEPYGEASSMLKQVLMTGVASVEDEPYTDRWGTFLSAYAPVYDANHHVVAASCVDMELSDYLLQLSELKHNGILNVIGAVSLSIIVGAVMGLYHRRLQRTVKQLMSARDAAMAASRAKSDFLATMSHELRTPMNGVIGMMDLLKASPLDASQKEYVQTACQSGESLMQLISDILDFSQLDAGSIQMERQPVSPNELVQSVKSQVEERLRQRDLKLEIAVDPDCPARFWGDEVRVRQVLLQLVGNAIKFTDKGSVHVSVLPEPGSMIHFVVKDTGIGISPSQQSHLFDAFFQGDGSIRRRHGGTGIGLAICKRLCDAMNGRLWFHSRPGEGTEFHLVIPAEEAPVEEMSLTGVNSGEAIIMTENSLVQILVLGVMEKLGLRVRVAPSVSALETEQRTRPAEIIMVDAAMVTTTEAEFFRGIRVGTSRTPRLYLLNAEPGKFSGGYFEAVFSQPLRPADLRRALQAAMPHGASGPVQPSPA